MIEAIIGLAVVVVFCTVSGGTDLGRIIQRLDKLVELLEEKR